MDKTVKAVGDWELDVLAIPFNTRDSDGQWFDEDTDIMPDAFQTPLVLHQHGVKQGATGIEKKPVILGKTVQGSLEKKADGWHVRVILDKAIEYAKHVMESAKNKMTAVSSGSVGHIARLEVGGQLIPYTKNRPGRIAIWPFAEISLWSTDGGNLQPANHTAYAYQALKAIYEEAGINLPSEIHPEANENAADDKPNNSKKEVKDMETNDVQKLIEDALKADREAQAQAQEAAKSRKAEIDAEVAKQVEAVKAEAAKGRRLPDYDGVAPYATKFNDSKFDNMSAGDLSIALSVLQSGGKTPSASAVKSLALKLISEKPRTEEREIDLRYIKSAMPASMKDEAALKAAEIMATGDTGNGAEWIGTAYSSELWRSIRHAGGIVEKLPQIVIPDGYSSQYFPLEGADPTWYKVAETTATDAVSQPTVSVTASKAGTDTRQVTVAKAGARVLYSGELTEDSIVAFAPQLREQMMVSGQELIEAFVINADSETAATTNINDIGGTPAASDWFMLGNGFRKLALVTNTANARSAGGALAIEDYLETMRLMGTAGLNAGDPSKVFFIVDPNVHYANMSLPEVKTRDVFSAATIENGFLKGAYGVQIFPSWQFHRGATGLKANTAGKVDLDTQGNNTTGAILCVRPDQWKFAYKRRMTMELTRFASSDTYEIVALARFGLAYRDTEASAITYNVGI